MGGLELPPEMMELESRCGHHGCSESGPVVQKRRTGQPLHVCKVFALGLCAGAEHRVKVNPFRDTLGFGIDLFSTLG